MSTVERPPEASNDVQWGSEHKARQLVNAAAGRVKDPMVEIDWDIPIDDSALHMPLAFLPLYGTSAWDNMSQQERYAYSRHEYASSCGGGIWLENLLMRQLLRHLYSLPAHDDRHRFLLMEIADECRHSAMFGEYIRRADTPWYGASRSMGFIGRCAYLLSTRLESYLFVLAGEEIFDACNVATMRDETCHPVARQIAKLHVYEEARHVSFAKSYLAENWPRVRWWMRPRSRFVAALGTAIIARSLINDEVYEYLEIHDGKKIAENNPVFQQRVIDSCADLVEFFTEVGIITPRTRFIWHWFGLISR